MSRKAKNKTSIKASNFIKVLAYAIPLLVLPSSLWRLALGVGVPVGFQGELAKLYHAPGWITLYVIVLGLTCEFFAFLAVGLVEPWGEVFSQRIPLVGGKQVPIWFATGAATIGAVCVTLLSIGVAASWYGPDNNGDPEAPHGLAGFIMTACYAPMLAWGPLLFIVTAAYLMRRIRKVG